jgi:hypothetical protein
VGGNKRKMEGNANEALYNLYLPNIISVITSKRMKWAGSVTYMGRTEMNRGLWLENLKKIDHF